MYTLKTRIRNFIYFSSQSKSEFTYRNSDHKYEMSRKEFRDWCSGIEQRFPYSAHIDGVVLHKTGDTQHGHCSQIAVFIRRSEESQIFHPDEESTQLYSELIYPFDVRTIQQKLKDFINYYNLYYSNYIDEEWTYNLLSNQKAILVEGLRNQFNCLTDKPIESEHFLSLLKSITTDNLQISEMNNRFFLIMTMEIEESDHEDEEVYEDEFMDQKNQIRDEGL